MSEELKRRKKQNVIEANKLIESEKEFNTLQSNRGEIG